MSRANPQEGSTQQAVVSVGRTRIIALPAVQNREPLTPEKLRTFPGCESYSDVEAQAIVETLSSLATLFLKGASKVGTHIDNQCVIKEIEQKTPLKRAA